MSSRMCALWLAVLLAPSCGCNMIAPIAYYLHPEQIQKAQFTFPPKARVAIVIDAAHPEDESPVFNQALYDKLVAYFLEYKSDAELIPLQEVYDLRRWNADFAKWPIQRIGREVNAEYVLYLRVNMFLTGESPEHPIFEPHVTMTEKVIAVDHPSNDARVWPTDREANDIECKRLPIERSDSEQQDAQIAKLGTDTAYYVMMPFFDVSLESKPPVER